MTVDDKFQATFTWMRREERRLLAIIQHPGPGKHKAWRKLMELSQRKGQLQREVKRFLDNHTTGNT